MSAGLPHAHGGPVLAGVLRSTPEDFEVEERLGFEPAGYGEHAFLRVRKRAANTSWVARQLARYAGVAPSAVGFAGLKDRHALAEQHFTVHLAGRPDPDWAALANAEFEVLSATRHVRKLPRGALAGNRFRIVLREIEGDAAAAERRLEALARDGAPNYFGEQRFGRDAGNVAGAAAMFAGRRVDRQQRAMLLSAARADIFNRVLARRVEAGTWNRILPGDVCQFDRSGARFGPVADDPALVARAAAGLLHPTGPLWGRGAPPCAGEVLALERAEADANAALAEGLARAGLTQQRRSLRALPVALRWRWNGSGTLELQFALGAGAYATAVLREVLRWGATAAPQ